MKIENAKVEVRCPYCGLVQTARLGATKIGHPSTVRCDVNDHDGCDELFVVDVRVQFVSTSYRIEADIDDMVSRTVIS